ncbi:putative ER degradation-enhancing alpha-mannosidase-like protein 3 isoform X2 [Apostichopus japonicus]|uniref:alpha-1,2-Mannosidase n=1 Tax=Stichopus japonicus TaxID=307972 RepID=A0A2G8KGT6_STIJA|nr:putative ER degradation-enhancing alpha-mannosidase-like protein 3 isoform X2 [Apostichopus japonicus]
MCRCRCNVYIFSLTLIDSLDTLAVLGLLDEFEDAVHRVVHDVTFDTDIVVSVFETNIRVLGGLLGGHVSAISLRKSHNRMAWYKDELLYMAKDLGYRLLPAFNTTTGVPYPRVNLRHGIGKDRKEKDTCTACAGSMLLEFSALSRLTGDPIFEDKAQHVMHTLWAKRQRSSNLVGTVINIHTGDWVRRDSGVGAGIDSYYEYLLKGYILLGDDGYYERFSTHYDAIMTYINKGPNFIDVHMHRPQSKSRNFMDALFAFWPGLQVLFGDIGPAIKTHEMLYQVTQRHKFLPEAFTPEYDVYWGQHPLRPEFVESTYFLYKATNDPHYLEVGRDVMDSLQKYARVPCGFAGIKDVRTGSHEDRMDSFVLAETFKYLFLLFSEPQDLVLPIDDYLFTTEAHLLPLTLANYKVNSTTTHMASHFSPSKDSPPTNSERSCPSHEFHFPSGKLYSAAVRNSLPSLQSTSCPTSNKETEISNKPSKPRLKASEFVPGNSEHMHQLGKMGIQLVTLDDGRVQLMHSASKAETPADAEEGMKFMQEIIEITKTQQAENVDYHPRVVQIISPDLLRNIVLAAGPAQFGADLDGSKKQAILGSLVQANPFHGCTELVNKDQVQGRIVMAQRGNCMFIEKARILEKLGALGVIITDNNESSSSDTSATFAMSGDGTDDVNIGVVFLFYKEGKILVDALQNNARVDVVVVDKAKSADEINILDIQLQMDERLGIAPVRANVGTPDARYYQQDDGGAAIPSGGPQSEGLQTTLPRQPTDSTSQGGMMPDEVELAGIKLSEGSITADASQDEDAAVIEEGSKQTSKPDKVFVNVDNVQDLLQYAGLEADLYLVNNHQNKLEEGREIYSKVSPQELQLRMEKILFKYMASDKGRTYQQDQQRSKDGGLESTSVGV